MNKIKIMTDSSSDLTMEVAQKHDIHILNFTVMINDKSYTDNVDMTNDEFYELMSTSSGFPKTSQITIMQFEEVYTEFFKEGYTDIIYVSISSTGSATYNNAINAIEMFYENVPEAKGKMNIHVVDSLNYTAAMGYPTIQAAIKAKKGADVSEILAYLDEWFSSVEVHFVPYTLEYVKRSGRLSAAAAFVGELLGLKPVINIIDGESHVPEKIRGEKNIMPKLIETAKKNMIPQTPYIVLAGSMEDVTSAFEKEITKALGYPPEYTAKIGITVASHAGPKVIGLIFKGQKRR